MCGIDNRNVAAKSIWGHWIWWCDKDENTDIIHHLSAERRAVELGGRPDATVLFPLCSNTNASYVPWFNGDHFGHSTVNAFCIHDYLHFVCISEFDFCSKYRQSRCGIRYLNYNQRCKVEIIHTFDLLKSWQSNHHYPHNYEYRILILFAAFHR